MGSSSRPDMLDARVLRWDSQEVAVANIGRSSDRQGVRRHSRWALERQLNKYVSRLDWTVVAQDRAERRRHQDPWARSVMRQLCENAVLGSSAVGVTTLCRQPPTQKK